VSLPNTSFQLRFASGSLKQLLQISYDEKLSSEVTPPDDIEGKLYSFIPSDYTKSEVAFDAIVEADAKTFKPIGEKVASYTRASPGKGKGKAAANGDVPAEDDADAVVFEMYKVCAGRTGQNSTANDSQTSWDTPGFREYHRRMQFFILLFIEGGSYIQEDEDAWEFITLWVNRNRIPPNSQV
jgi:histone acetyltransferase 1